MIFGRRRGRRQLDAAAWNPHHRGISRPDGRSRYGRKAAGEESPGSIDIRCRITSGGGDPRDSATENKPPEHAPARVKRCGKSAPRAWQQERQGKPHREQDRIGTARRLVRQGFFRPAVRVGCEKHPATDVPDEWSSSVPAFAGGGVDRTRLTGRLAPFPVEQPLGGRFSPHLWVEMNRP